MVSAERSELGNSLRQEQKSLNDAIDAYTALVSQDDADKLELESARRLVVTSSSRITDSVKNPNSGAMLLGIQPLLNTAIRIAIDLGLFSIISSKATTVDDIVAATSADRTLVIRITRCMAAFHILKEAAPFTFTSTSQSSAFTHPVLAAWLKMNYDITVPRNYRIPSFLAQNSHSHTVSIDAFNASEFSGMSVWDQLSTNQSQLATFQTAMKLNDVRSRGEQPDYDFTSNLSSLPASGIVLIDVGGGHGHALDTIINDHPTLSGRFILQDLPGPVEQVKADKSRKITFEPMSHDFFTPQPPSLLPRWYYLRHVLHDWADDACIQILKHLREAISNSPGSTILIRELVLPDMGATQYDTLMDINMMEFGGMERSGDQWRKLLGKVDLEIVGITKAKLGDRCIMEVGVKNAEGWEVKSRKEPVTSKF